MRVMVIVKATNESEDGGMPPAELLEQTWARSTRPADATPAFSSTRPASGKAPRARASPFPARIAR